MLLHPMLLWKIDSQHLKSLLDKQFFSINIGSDVPIREHLVCHPFLFKHCITRSGDGIITRQSENPFSPQVPPLAALAELHLDPDFPANLQVYFPSIPGALD